MHVDYRPDVDNDIKVKVACCVWLIANLGKGVNNDHNDQECLFMTLVSEE